MAAPAKARAMKEARQPYRAAMKVRTGMPAMAETETELLTRLMARRWASPAKRALATARVTGMTAARLPAPKRAAASRKTGEAARAIVTALATAARRPRASARR